MNYFTKGTNYQKPWKNPWGDRLLFLKDHLPSGTSVVDFGCGNKEILEYFSPSEYFGIDLDNPAADLHYNLNQDIDLDRHYQTGLIIGVLEYLDDPEKTLKNLKKFADEFFILVSVAPKKDQWKNSFTKDSILTIVKSNFKNVKSFDFHRYVLCVVTD